MLAATALLLAHAAFAEPTPIGLYLEQSEGLAAEEARALSARLAGALEVCTGRRSFVASEAERGCQDKGCLDQLRASLGVSDLVLLKLFAAGERLRLVAARIEAPDVAAERVQVDLLRGDEPGALASVARLLYPRAAAVPSPSALPSPAIAPAAPAGLGIWLASAAVGLGAVATGSAIALRVASDGARAEVATRRLDAETRQATQDRSVAQGTISNLLFGVAAGLVAGGVVYLWSGSTTAATEAPPGAPTTTN
jgi:hypothetical protein